MNERHPSGYSDPATASSGLPYTAAPVGDPYAAGLYEQQTQHSPGGYGYPGYDGYSGYEDYGTGAYAAYPGPAYDTGGYDTAAYDTGVHQAGGWDTGGYGAVGYDAAAYDTGTYETGAYDTGAYAVYDTGSYDTAAYATGGYPAAGYEAAGYDGSAPWDTAQQQPYNDYADYTGYDAAAYDTGGHAVADATEVYDAPLYADEDPYGTHDAYGVGTDTDGEAPLDPPPAAVVHHPRSAARRRPKPKRSALLTVAVPSMCVMGVAGAAAVNVMGDDGSTEVQAEDTAAEVSTAAAPADQKLDSQLAGLSRGADDFADRAGRAQERVDLKERQAAERERKRKEAARREAMRPKFVLPVAQHGLSALFGSAGLNWMNLHSGIDFPVDVGTPVKSATDGTIVAKINPSYGNVAEVTMDDGTKILYAHLSSIKIRTGRVKAGDVIAYSGDTGNSTGPHLHFEVRPNGESAVDPLPWLRARGLNPE